MMLLWILWERRTPVRHKGLETSDTTAEVYRLLLQGQKKALPLPPVGVEKQDGRDLQNERDFFINLDCFHPEYTFILGI